MSDSSLQTAPKARADLLRRKGHTCIVPNWFIMVYRQDHFQLKRMKHKKITWVNFPLPVVPLWNHNHQCCTFFFGLTGKKGGQPNLSDGPSILTRYMRMIFYGEFVGCKCRYTYTILLDVKFHGFNCRGVTWSSIQSLLTKQKNKKPETKTSWKPQHNK